MSKADSKRPAIEDDQQSAVMLLTQLAGARTLRAAPCVRAMPECARRRRRESMMHSGPSQRARNTSVRCMRTLTLCAACTSPQVSVTYDEAGWRRLPTPWR